MQRRDKINLIKKIVYGKGKLPAIPEEDLHWLKSKGFTRDAYESGRCLIIVLSEDAPRARRILKHLDSNKIKFITITERVNEKDNINNQYS